jgi:hypothetical protein
MAWTGILKRVLVHVLYGYPEVGTSTCICIPNGYLVTLSFRRVGRSDAQASIPMLSVVKGRGRERLPKDNNTLSFRRVGRSDAQASIPMLSMVKLSRSDELGVPTPRQAFRRLAL